MKKLLEIENGRTDKDFSSFLNKAFLLNYQFVKVSLNTEQNKNQKLQEEIEKKEEEIAKMIDNMKSIDKVLIRKIILAYYYLRNFKKKEILLSSI